MIQVEQPINSSSTFNNLNHNQKTKLNGSTKYSSKSAPLVEKIRNRFFNEEWPKNSDQYCEQDIQRVKQSEWFIKRFLLASRRNVDEAYDMLKTTLQWRKKHNLPNVKPNFFPKEFYEIGGLFSYEPDLQGNPVIYLRIRMHKKIKEIHEPLQQFLFYTIERVDQETNCNGCVIVFDCNGAGYSNMDLELLRSLVDVAFKYFPFCIRYVIVYELSWMLNAFRKIAMTFIPSSFAQIVRFANKQDITNFIPLENLPDFMGGTCKRNYREVPHGCRTVLDLAYEHGFTIEDAQRIMTQFEPLLKESREAIAAMITEQKAKAIEYSIVKNNNNNSNLEKNKNYDGDSDGYHDHLNDLKAQKNFAKYDIEEKETENKSIALVHSPVSKSCSHIATIYPQNVIHFKRIILNSESKPEKEKNIFTTKTRTTNTSTMAATIMIRNNHSSKSLAFKIQCNRSDRYLVTPNQGVLLPHAYISIRIVMLTKAMITNTTVVVGKNPTMLINQKENQDKFLILMSSAVDLQVHLKNSKEFNKLFIGDIDQIYVHKLIAQLENDDYGNIGSSEVFGHNTSKGNEMETLINELKTLKKNYKKLEQHHWWLKLFLTLIIIVLLIFLISFPICS